MSEKNILFMPKWNYSTQVMWPVAEETVRRGYRPLFLLSHYDEKILSWLRHREVAAFTVSINEIQSPPLWKSVLGIGGVHADIQVKQWAESFLTKVKPSAVLVCDDQMPVEQAIIRLANRAGIPTVVMQWSFSNPQSDYDAQRQALLNRFGERSKNESFMFGTQSWTGRNGEPADSVRSRLREVLSKKKSFMMPLVQLRDIVLSPLVRNKRQSAGVNYQRKHTFGGGEAVRFAVLGPSFIEQFQAQGVPREKMVVTGLTDHDALHLLSESEIERSRESVIAEFRLDPRRPIVYRATRPSLEDGYPVDIARGEIQTILNAILARKERWQVIIKLHPRTNLERFQSWLTPSRDVHIVKDFSKAALMCACDLFVSTYSSTILEALAFDKPVFCYNLLRIPGGDIFAEQVGGVIHARQADEVKPAIDSLLDDPATRHRLQLERERAKERYMMFDGKVAERIADLLVTSDVAEEAVA